MDSERQARADVGICLDCAQAHIYPYEGYAREVYGCTCLCDHSTDAAVCACEDFMPR